MKIEHRSPKSLRKTPFLVVFLTEGEKPKLPLDLALPRSSAQDFDGGCKKQLMLYPEKGGVERLLLVGLGKPAAVDAEVLRKAAAIASKRADAAGAASIAFWIHDELADRAGGPGAVATALVEGGAMGLYRYDRHKSDAKPSKVKELLLYGEGVPLARGLEHGRITTAANLYARDLQNAPGNHLTPRMLAAAARKLAATSTRVRCQVFDAKAMERLGMGLLLSVAQGSKQPPQLIHLSYQPKGRSKGRIAIVGKGLTFDAGGYSLKPALRMDDMRFDMSGGAAVLGLFHALCELDLPLEVHGVVPSSENLIDGGATKPGDVHTAMNGKTVEILNTDAEGRLILADALCYCVQKIKPDTIIDLATLTGAVVTALGHELSGLFASEKALEADLLEAGEAVGERLWPLPLLEYHKGVVKGVQADLKNIASSEVGAGSTVGAAFLSHFVGDKSSWAHLDIAGTAYGSANREWVGGARGSGVGTRLLIQYLLSRASGR